MAEKASKKPPQAPPPLKGVSQNSQEDMLAPGEQVITEVRQSIIGLIKIYLIALIAVAAITTLIIVLAPDFFKTSGSSISGSLSAAMLLSAILLVLIFYTATYIYRQSKLLITDRSLIQILQKSLFIRKVSRLSMADVEDVSTDRRGILASIFNYGTLTVETAGEIENFVFPYCPNPEKYADQIIEARQSFMDEDQQAHKTP